MPYCPLGILNKFVIPLASLWKYALKNKLIDTDNRMVFTGGDSRWEEGEVVKGVKYVVTK